MSERYRRFGKWPVYLDYFVKLLAAAYSFNFYRWMRPDMARTVRIGFQDSNVDYAVNSGTIIFTFISACIVAPFWPRRHVALAGNAGMAISSIIVIVNHFLMEKKWIWAGLLYILNIWLYCASAGLVLMGQFTKYHYDWNRLKKMATPIFSALILFQLGYTFHQKTVFDDFTPFTSFVVHTIMAIIAQVAAPRSKCWNMFEFLQQTD